jgi:type I restriction enzyme S subunit
MEVRPGYKMTEVGVIPEDWQLRGLLTTVSIANGQVDPRNEPFKSMILVAPDHIESGTGKLLEKRTAADQRAISGKYLFDSGDIVYSKIRPYLQKAIMVDFTGLCSADMYPLKPAVDVIGGFVLPVLLAHRFTKYAESVSVRSGMPKINRNEMADFVVALPPPPEQRAIAAALNDVDVLVSALDRLIAKKRDLKQAAMQQLLTGKVRLPGFSGEWEVKRLGDVLKYERPDKYLVRSTDYEEKGDTPVLTANKSFLLGFTNEDFGIYDTPPVIIFDDFTTDTKYVDFSFKLKSSAIKILKVRNSDVSLKFIFERMRLIRFPLGEHKRYYISDYQHIELLTPDPEEQSAIAAFLSDMDTEIEALEARRAKTRDMKQAMMQELLTGRIRLVQPEVAHA